jgi:hypothetical protein
LNLRQHRNENGKPRKEEKEAYHKQHSRRENTVCHGKLFPVGLLQACRKFGVSIIETYAYVFCIKLTVHIRFVQGWDGANVGGTTYTHLRFYRRQLVAQYASPTYSKYGMRQNRNYRYAAGTFWVDTSDFPSDSSFANTILGNNE